MILCHKDSGLLANDPDENIQGILGCGCISGWVRGFEPNLNREQAIRQQIEQCFNWIHLYTQQDRTQDWMDKQYARAEKLMDLL